MGESFFAKILHDMAETGEIDLTSHTGVAAKAQYAFRL